MSGRRYIIHSALQLPDTVPSTAAGRARVEKLARKFYFNAAMAVEYETHPDKDDIIETLKADPMSSQQLQDLLDWSHD